MHDVVLTVPHGHADNDRAAEPVARAIKAALAVGDEPIKAILLVNRLDRKGMDCNRPESRGRKFRRAISDEISKGARLVVDVHSFKPTSRRFRHKDIVLLHTPGLQSLAFLERYARLLRKASRALRHRDVQVEVEAAQKVDDVCVQARELGVRQNEVLLAEHNDLGHPDLAAKVYSGMHAMAIRWLLENRNKKERDA